MEHILEFLQDVFGIVIFVLAVALFTFLLRETGEMQEHLFRQSQMSRDYYLQKVMTEEKGEQNE